MKKNSSFKKKNQKEAGGSAAPLYDEIVNKK
jgi:hypothetical protein